MNRAQGVSALRDLVLLAILPRDLTRLTRRRTQTDVRLALRGFNNNKSSWSLAFLSISNRMASSTKCTSLSRLRTLQIIHIASLHATNPSLKFFYRQTHPPETDQMVRTTPKRLDAANGLNVGKKAYSANVPSKRNLDQCGSTLAL
jgi:hypothetical protein